MIRAYVHIAVCSYGELIIVIYVFFFSSRRRHTRYIGDWSSDVCSSDLRERERERDPNNKQQQQTTTNNNKQQQQQQQTTVEIGRATCRERKNI